MISLHTLGIHHNDITSSNLLVNGNIVKFCDFGWSEISTCDRNPEIFSSDIYYAIVMLDELGYKSKYLDKNLLNRALNKDSSLHHEDLYKIIQEYENDLANISSYIKEKVF